MNHKPLFLFISFCLALFSSLFAQNTSAVKGTIRDKESKEAIADVKITVISTKVATLKFELNSDDKGTILKKGIIPGVYQIMYEKSGYIPASATTRLSVGVDQDISTEMERIKDQLSPGNRALKEIIDLFTSEKYAQALPILEGGLNVDSQNTMLHFYYGLALEKTGKSEAALVSYQKTFELKPDFELALSSAAKLLARKGSFEQAVVLYQKVDALGSKDAIALYNYGVCLINLGKTNEAKTIFEKVLAIDPENADTFYELGIIHLGLGEIPKAKEFLQKFITLDPENPKKQSAQEIMASL